MIQRAKENFFRLRKLASRRSFFYSQFGKKDSLHPSHKSPTEDKNEDFSPRQIEQPWKKATMISTVQVNTTTECYTEAWKYWESKFRASKADLLSEYVDPIEEEHMKLIPVKNSSSTKKSHKRKASDMSTDTATTAAMSEVESGHSFLEECFDIPIYNNNDNDPLRFL